MSKYYDDDTRVISLVFDNSKFESNARTSLSTLERLKEALKFSEGTQAFNDIANSIKSINVSPLANGIETISTKMSALDVITKRWFENFTDSAYNRIASFVKSVSVDQVSAGFSKYAEKTSAVQTIMSATAQDFADEARQMKVVNEQLDKLNWFTDETSYNFVDMTNNIGKFTSAGVKLEDAVTAMQGISTWAAKSGANVGEASRAMYNLSQAMGTGSVKLIDWKSIENANMATMEFKQAVIEAAEAAGTLVKAGEGVWHTLEGNDHIVTVKNFNEYLKDSWFTSDILIKTLDKYGGFTNKLYETMERIDYATTTSRVLEWVDDYKAGAMGIEELNDAADQCGITVESLKKILTELGSSEFDFGRKAFAAAQEAKTFAEAIDSVKDAVSSGWMNTFEILFGDYLQAKDLWTELANDLYDVFAESGNRRNQFLKKAFSSKTIVDVASWNKLVGLGKVTNDQIAQIIETGKKYGAITESMDISTKNFVESLNDEWLSLDMLNVALGKLNPAEVADVEDIDRTYDMLHDLVREIIDGKWGSGAELTQNLLNNAWDPDLVNEYMDLLSELTGGTMNITDEVLKEADAIAQNTLNLRAAGLEASMLKSKQDELNASYKDAIELEKDLLFNSETGKWESSNLTTQEIWINGLKNAMTLLAEAFEFVSTTWNDVFGGTKISTVRSLIISLYNGIEKLRYAIKNAMDPEKPSQMRDALTIVFTVLKGIVDIVKGGVISAFNNMRTIFDLLSGPISYIVSMISKAVVEFRHLAEENPAVKAFFETVQNGIGFLITKGVFTKLLTMILGLGGGISALGSKFNILKNTALGLKGGLLFTFIPKIAEVLGNFLGKLENSKLKDIPLTISKKFEILREAIVETFKDIPGISIISDALSWIGEKVVWLIETISGLDIIGSITTGFGTAIDWIKGKIGGIADGTLLSGPLKLVGDIFGAAGGLISSGFESLFGGVTVYADELGEAAGEIEKTENVFSKFIDKVSSFKDFSFANIIIAFNELKNDVFDYLDNFEGFDGIRTAFDNLQSFIHDKLESIGIDGDKALTVLKGIADIIIGLFNTVTGVLGGALTFVIDNIVKFFGSEAFARNIENFGKAFKQLGSNTFGFLTGIGGQFGEFIGKVKELGGFKLNNLSDVFTSFRDTVVDYIRNFDGFSLIVDAFKGLGNDISDAFENVGININGVLETIKGFLKMIIDGINSIKIPKVLDGALDTVKLFADGASNAVSGLTKSGEAFSGFFNTVGESAKSVTDNIPFSLDSLFGAVTVYADDIESAAETVSESGNIFSNIFTMIGNGAAAIKSGIDGFVSNITAWAGSMGLLTDEMKSWIEPLSAIAKVFIAFKMFKAVKKALSGALDIFGEFTGGVLSSIKSITTAISSFAEYQNKLAEAELTEKKGRAFKDRAIGIALIAAAFIELAGAALIISKLPEKDIIKAAGFLGGFAVAIGVLSVIFSKFKGIGKAGIGIFAMTSSIYLIIGVIEVLAHLPIVTIQQAGNAIEWLLLIAAYFTVLFLTTRAAGKNANAAGKAALKISIAIGIMAGAIFALSHMNFSNLPWVIITLGAITAALGTLMALTDKVKGKGVVGLALISTMVGSLAIMITAISHITNTGTALAITLGIASIFVALAALVNQINKLGNSQHPYKSMLVILSLTAMLGAIAAMFYFIKDGMDPEECKWLALGIAAIIATLAIVLWQATKLRNAQHIGSVVKSILMLDTVIAAIGGLIFVISKFTDADKSVRIMDALVKTFIALSGVMMAMALIGQFKVVFASSIVKVLAVVAVAVAAFAGIAGLLGWLDKEWGIGNSIDKGIQILINIAEGIGRFFAAFFTGHIKQLFEALPTVSENIKIFSDTLTSIKSTNIDWTSVYSTLGQTLKIIEDIAWQELWNALPNFVSNLVNGKGAVKQFADELQALADGLTGWSDKMKTISKIYIPVDELNTLEDHIRDIGGLEFVNSIYGALTGGFGGNFKGAGGAFSDDLSNVAEGIKTWATTMTEISEIKIPAEKIKGLKDEITGIAVDEFWGSLGRLLVAPINNFSMERDTSKFRRDVEEFSSAISKWQETMNQIGDLTVPVESISTLVSTVKELPHKDFLDTLADWFGGESKAITFSTIIGELGLALQKFSNNLGEDFRPANVTNAVNAIEILCRACVDIQNSIFLTTELVDRVCENIGKIIDLIKDINGVNVDSVDAFMSAFETLSTLDVSKSVSKPYEMAAEAITYEAEQLSVKANKVNAKVAEEVQSGVVGAVDDYSKDVADIVKKYAPNSSAYNGIIFTSGYMNTATKMQDSVKELLGMAKDARYEAAELLEESATAIEDSSYAIENSASIASSAIKSANQELRNAGTIDISSINSDANDSLGKSVIDSFDTISKEVKNGSEEASDTITESYTNLRKVIYELSKATDISDLSDSTIDYLSTFYESTADAWKGVSKNVHDIRQIIGELYDIRNWQDLPNPGGMSIGEYVKHYFGLDSLEEGLNYLIKYDGQFHIITDRTRESIEKGGEAIRKWAQSQGSLSFDPSNTVIGQLNQWFKKEGSAIPEEINNITNATIGSMKLSDDAILSQKKTDIAKALHEKYNTADLRGKNSPSKVIEEEIDDIRKKVGELYNIDNWAKLPKPQEGMSIEEYVKHYFGLDSLEEGLNYWIRLIEGDVQNSIVVDRTRGPQETLPEIYEEQTGYKELPKVAKDIKIYADDIRRTIGEAYDIPNYEDLPLPGPGMTLDEYLKHYFGLDSLEEGLNYWIRLDTSDLQNSIVVDRTRGPAGAISSLSDACRDASEQVNKDIKIYADDIKRTVGEAFGIENYDILPEPGNFSLDEYLKQYFGIDNINEAGSFKASIEEYNVSGMLHKTLRLDHTQLPEKGSASIPKIVEDETELQDVPKTVEKIEKSGNKLENAVQNALNIAGITNKKVSIFDSPLKSAYGSKIENFTIEAHKVNSEAIEEVHTGSVELAKAEDDAIDTIMDHAPAKVLNDLIVADGILEATSGTKNSITSGVKDSIQSGLKEIADTARTGSEDIKTSFEDVRKTIGDAFDIKNWEDLPEPGSMDLNEYLKQYFGIDNLEGAGSVKAYLETYDVDGMVHRTITIDHTSLPAPGSVSLPDIMNDMTNADKLGETAIDIGSGIDTVKETVINSLKDLGSGISYDMSDGTYVDTMKEMIGIENFDAITEALEEKGGNFIGTLIDTITGIQNVYADEIPDGKTLDEQVKESIRPGSLTEVGGVVDEINQGSVAVGNAITGLATVANGTESKEALDNFATSTSESLTAMQDSINSLDISIFATAIEGIRASLASLTDYELDKLAFLAIGITDLRNILSGDSEYNPRVVPVLDFSLLEEGAQSITDMFNRETLTPDLTGLVQAQIDLSPVERAVDDLRVTTQNEMGAIRDYIGAVSNQVGNLASAINSIQLRLDTGALVGEIAPQINNQLGIYATYGV